MNKKHPDKIKFAWLQNTKNKNSLPGITHPFHLFIGEFIFSYISLNRCKANIYFDSFAFFTSAAQSSPILFT